LAPAHHHACGHLLGAASKPHHHAFGVQTTVLCNRMGGKKGEPRGDGQGPMPGNYSLPHAWLPPRSGGAKPTLWPLSPLWVLCFASGEQPLRLGLPFEDFREGVSELIRCEVCLSQKSAQEDTGSHDAVSRRQRRPVRHHGRLFERKGAEDSPLLTPHPKVTSSSANSA